MELEERIGNFEKICFRIASLAGVILGGLTVLTLAVFEYAKMIKYLWRSWRGLI